MNVAVNGAAGAMGRRVVSLVSQASQCRLVCALERAGHPALGQDAGVLVGAGALGIRLGVDLCGAPDVLIDFSAPESTMERARQCAAAGVAFVTGTTGLTEAELAELRDDVATRVPLLAAPNMSIGVNLLFRLAAEVARALGDGYDIEIVEAHHRRKKDAPSGTAAELARRICAELERDPAVVLRHGREGLCGPRTPEEIGIHAVRGGDIVGDHTVIFAAEGERVELVHKASSRDVFARGAVRAAVFLAGREPGVYSMQDVLA